MSHYFLHIMNRIGFAPDEEGVDAETLDEAIEFAKDGIRSILSDEAKHGRLDLNGRIEITDGSGKVCAVVPFPDAVELTLPAERAYPDS